MASQTFTIRMSDELLETVDMIGQATGSNRNAVLNKFTKDAIAAAYNKGRQYLLLEHLRDNKLKIPKEPAEIERLIEEVQSKYDWNATVLIGLMEK